MSDRGPARPSATTSASSTEASEEQEAPALLDIAEASMRAPHAAATEAASTGLPAGALSVARARRLDAEGAEIELCGRIVMAAVDAAVHRDVVETACARGEMVLVTVDATGRATLVGALRTQPTPGVDAMDTITLTARRIELEAGEELQLRSGIAVLAVRAIGEVETYADRIVSRAEELQKIVGRMLRLN